MAASLQSLLTRAKLSAPNPPFSHPTLSGSWLGSTYPSPRSLSPGDQMASELSHRFHMDYTRVGAACGSPALSTWIPP